MIKNFIQLPAVGFEYARFDLNPGILKEADTFSGDQRI